MPKESSKIDLTDKVCNAKGESKLLVLFKRLYRKDTPSDNIKDVVDDDEYEAPTWSARYKIPNGGSTATGRRYTTKSMKTKDKDIAIKRAIQWYEEVIGASKDNTILKREIELRNVVDRVRVLDVVEIEGSWGGKVCYSNKQVKTLLKKYKYLDAAFLYAIFPSMEHPPKIMKASPLDSLILNGDLARGKIGITGTNSENCMFQLRNRIDKYKVAVSRTDWGDVKDREFEWTKGLCAPNEKWYAAIFYLSVESELDCLMKTVDIQTLEKVVISAWASRYHKFPKGNLGEQTNAWSNPSRRPDNHSGGGSDNKKGKPLTTNLMSVVKVIENDEIIEKPKGRGYSQKDMEDFDYERGYRWVYDKKVTTTNDVDEYVNVITHKIERFF